MGKLSDLDRQPEVTCRTAQGRYLFRPIHGLNDIIHGLLRTAEVASSALSKRTDKDDKAEVIPGSKSEDRGGRGRFKSLDDALDQLEICAPRKGRPRTKEGSGLRALEPFRRWYSENQDRLYWDEKQHEVRLAP